MDFYQKIYAYLVKKGDTLGDIRNKAQELKSYLEKAENEYILPLEELINVELDDFVIQSTFDGLMKHYLETLRHVGDLIDNIENPEGLQLEEG